jgi:four helix bundle protein
LKLVDALPDSVSARTIASQIARSGSSVAANYRAACRAKSRADFVSKLGTVEEEAGETLFWLEMIAAAKLLPPARLAALQKEADELIAITVSSINAARKNQQSEIRNRKTNPAIRNPHSAIKP